MVRVASFNVENLFERPKALASDNEAETQTILSAYAEVNHLLAKATYTTDDQVAIKNHLSTLRVLRRNDQGRLRLDTTLPPAWAWFRENHDHLFRLPGADDEDLQFQATGRGDWVGWVELVTEAVDDTPVQMTARVVRDVDADIVAVVEAEHRPSLKRFNDQLLGKAYQHVMLVDGNDDRGIDVGLMTKAGLPIGTITSNVDVMDGDDPVFSRDCPQYQVTTPSGNLLHLLVNHFKSQTKDVTGDDGGKRRKKQAETVRAIVDRLVDAGKYVIVLGDLNEGPNPGFEFAKNLRKLYEDESPLVDCWSLAAFEQNGAPGSYRRSNLRNRLDYIFVSKNLVDRVQGGGVFRKGLWRDNQAAGHWEMYPELTRPNDAASDHAMIYVDIDI